MDWVAAVVLLSTVFVRQSLALYEDQVGNFDWYQRYVGAVSYVSVERSAKSSRSVVLASESGVLAAVDPHNGDLVWRHVYEEGGVGQIDAVLRSPLGSLLTLSSGGQLLRSWEMSSGILKWERATELPSVDKRSYPLDVSWRPGSAIATLTGKNGGTAVVASGTKVVSYSSRTGDKRWTFDLGKEGGVASSLSSSGQVVYLLSVVEQSKVVVTMLNGSKGDVLKTQQLHAPWFMSESTSCLLTTSHVVCLQLTRLDLYFAELGTDSSFSLNMLPSETLQNALSSSSGDVARISLLPSASPTAVWLKLGRGYYHLISLSGPEETAILVAELKDGLPLIGWLDGDIERPMDVVLKEDNERGSLIIEISGKGTEKVEGSVDMETNRGLPLYGDVKLFTKSDGSVGYSVAVVMEDFTTIMLKSKGISWHREEALGGIAAVELLDLPASESELIETFVELTKGETNPVRLATLRLHLQFQLVKDFLLSLQERGVASLLERDRSGTDLIRDEFNTNKMIIAATENGKLYGLDSSNGRLVWQRYLAGLEAFSLDARPQMHILRTTSHPPHPPLAIVVGGAKASLCEGGGSAMFTFNPLTGSGDSPRPTCLPEVIQTLLLPVLDHTHSRIFLMLTKDKKVLSYPSLREVSLTLSELKEQLFFYTADREHQAMTGYRVITSPPAETLATQQMWTLNFPADSERIVSTIAKSSSERVNSQGRVHPNRSVQYKYLNPNLVAVVTESTDTSKPFVSVYLVDGVSGGVVFHTTHKQAAGPVHLVHSENWIVYQYQNLKQRRHELVVSELYETHTNQSHTEWSSLYPPVSPDVTSQAYAFPTTLHTITTTQTLNGITHKSILLGEHSGHIASVPKRFLDPRRSVEATDAMKEEGIPPYLPGIDLRPVTFINYNQTVSRLRQIHTFPSGLESTCLVFAAGLDLYFTRVMPSKQFDLLAVDFDYTLISAVVLGMAAATLILSKLASRKMLRAQWK